MTDPGELTAEGIGALVKAQRGGGGGQVVDVAVVHVLSHGMRTPGSGDLHVVGSDTDFDDVTMPEFWRRAVTNRPTAPATLFLLDICHAGAANQHWRPPPPDVAEKAWVIAAADADQPAYAGRLTRAATEVIDGIVTGRDPLDERVEFVGFEILFTRITDRVARFAHAEGGYHQEPVCTPMMPGQPAVRFFDNPRWAGPNPVADAARSLDPAAARVLHRPRPPAVDAGGVDGLTRHPRHRDRPI